MKRSELSPKQILSVPCPVCGAAAGERCVLNSGLPRFESHADRKFAAIEFIEKDSANSLSLFVSVQYF